jgi:hypothetical protein
MRYCHKVADIPDPKKTPLIVVDVANIREMRPGRTLMVVRKKEEEVFDPEVVFLVMRALERLSNGIPIIYVMDKGIRPHFPNEEFDSEFLSHLKKDPRTEGKILLTKSKFRNGDAKTTKADEVICKLHNNLGAIVISRDKFGSEISSGLMQHPETLRSFRPRWDPIAKEIYFENIGRCESKRTIQELCYSLTPVVGVRGQALALIHKLLDAESRRQKTPKSKLSKAQVTKTEYEDYESDWQKYNEQDVRVTFNPFSKLTQAYGKKIPSVGELQKKEVVPVRMFEFSQQERNASSGERINVIGRILHTDDGKPYLSWFGSTVPIFLDTSHPLTSQSFISVYGVLRVQDAAWLLNEVDNITDISQADALNSGRKPLKQHQFATSYLPWGIRRSPRRAMSNPEVEVVESETKVRKEEVESVKAEENPLGNQVTTQSVNTSRTPQSAAKSEDQRVEVPTTTSQGSHVQTEESQMVEPKEDQPTKEIASTSVPKSEVSRSRRSAPLIRPIHAAVAIAIVLAAALVVFIA